MRQSRYLLVSNLPENVSAERITEHFKKFGKVQSVKFLPSSGASDEDGLCAAVAFTDIRSAAKAFNNPDNKIDDRVLKTDYYEPPATSSLTSATIFIHETREDVASLSRQSSQDSSSTSHTNSNKSSSLSNASGPNNTVVSSAVASNQGESKVSSNITSNSNNINSNTVRSRSRSPPNYTSSSFPHSSSSSSSRYTSSSLSHVHLSSTSSSSCRSGSLSSSSRERTKRLISDGTSNSNRHVVSSRFNDEDDRPPAVLDNEDDHLRSPRFSSNSFHRRRSDQYESMARSPSKSISDIISDNSCSRDRLSRERVGDRGEDRSSSPRDGKVVDAYNDKRRRSSKIRSSISDMNPRRQLIRSSSSPGRTYHPQDRHGLSPPPSSVTAVAVTDVVNSNRTSSSQELHLAASTPNNSTATASSHHNVNHSNSGKDKNHRKSSHSESSRLRSRSSSSSGGNKEPAPPNKTVYACDEVNHSLTDPRRGSSTPSSSTAVFPTSSLLNSSSSSSASSKKVESIDAESGLVSSTDSLPQDVHSTTNKSEELHACEVSSSSDKASSKPSPKKVLKLPLPEFAVLLLGSTAKALLNSTPLIPGLTSLIVNPVIPSPKNTSITSPINNFSPCPLPPKRIRDRSTDSKGSEVTTSDRDSTENNPLNVSLKSSLDTSSSSEENAVLRSSSPLNDSKSLEDRIKALDEKYIPWSNKNAVQTVVSVTSLTSTPAVKETVLPPAAVTPTIDYSKYNIKKKSQVTQGSGSQGETSSKNEPSDIVKNLLLKSSIFDQDSKRLEHINEKYEGKEAGEAGGINPIPSSSVTTASSSSSGASSSSSSVKPVIRTKAAAKEFASSSSVLEGNTPSTPSKLNGIKSHSSSLSSSSTGLGSLSRKMSEPSKLPSVKKDAPSTPLSAPARSFSTAFPPFASEKSKESSIKTSSKDAVRRDSDTAVFTASSRDPRAQKGSETDVLHKKVPLVQKSHSVPSSSSSSSSSSGSKTPTTSSIKQDSCRVLPVLKEKEGENKRRSSSNNITEGMDVDSSDAGDKESKGSITATSSSKNEEKSGGKLSSKSSSVKLPSKSPGEQQSSLSGSIKNKDKVGGEKTSKTSVDGSSKNVSQDKERSKQPEAKKILSSKKPSVDSSAGKNKESSTKNTGSQLNSSLGKTSLMKEKEKQSQAKSTVDKPLKDKQRTTASGEIEKKKNKDSNNKTTTSSKDNNSSKDREGNNKNRENKDKTGQQEKSKEQSLEEKRAWKRMQELRRLGITEEPVYFSMYDKVKARSSAKTPAETAAAAAAAKDNNKSSSTSSKSRKISSANDDDDEDDEDSDSSDSDSDSSSSSSSSSERKNKKKRVSLKRKKKPVIESSSSSSSSTSSSSSSEEHDDDDDEPASRRKTAAQKSPVRKQSVNNNNKNNKRSLVKSSDSDSDEQVVKSKRKKLKTKGKKPNRYSSDSPSDDDDEDDSEVFRSKRPPLPPSSSSVKPHKSLPGKASSINSNKDRAGPGILSSDDQSSTHESKGSSKGLEAKKNKKQISSDSKDKRKEGIPVSSSSSSNKHPNNTEKGSSKEGKKHDKASDAGRKSEKHETKMHHKDSFSSTTSGESLSSSKIKAAASVGNESSKDKNHSSLHATPSSSKSSSSSLETSSKQHHKLEQQQQLKKKKKLTSLSSSSSSGMKSVEKTSEKDERTKGSSSHNKEKEKGLKSFEKKQDNEGRDGDKNVLHASNTSLSSSASPPKKKKKSKNDKNGSSVKEDKSSSIHSKSSSKQTKNCSSSATVKTSSGDSVSSKERIFVSKTDRMTSSDQEMKSDFSDSELNFRRLQSVLQSDSSDEPSSDQSPPPPSVTKTGVKGNQVSPGVISHTEWERAECGKNLVSFKHGNNNKKSSHLHDKNHADSKASHLSMEKTPAFKKSKGLHRLQKEQEHAGKTGGKNQSCIDHKSSVLSSSGQDNKKNKKQHKSETGLHSVSSLDDIMSKKQPHPLERLRDMKEGLPSLPSSKIFGHNTLHSSLFSSDRKASPPVVSSTSDSLGRLKSPSSIRDDMSDSSEDLRLDQDLNEEARRSAEKAEHLADSESSSDELMISTSPCDLMSGKKNQDKEPRRFDQEAAIETKRLEVELNQPWIKKEPHRQFEELLCSNTALKTGLNEDESNVVSLHIPDTPSLSIHIPGIMDSPNKNLPHDSPNLGFKHHMPSSLIIGSSPNSAGKGLSLEHLPLVSEQESKVSLEGSQEESSTAETGTVDDQRIMEDDLAVSALLQEMDDKPLENQTLEGSLPETGMDEIPVYDHSHHHLSMITDDEPPPLQISEEQPSLRSSNEESSPLRDVMLNRIPSSHETSVDAETSSCLIPSSLANTAQLPEELLLQSLNQTHRSIQQLNHHRSIPGEQREHSSQRIHAADIKERIERLSVSSSGSASSRVAVSPSHFVSSSPSKRLSTESQPDDEKHSSLDKSLGGKSTGDEGSSFLQETPATKETDSKERSSTADTDSKEESEDTSRSSDRPKRGRRPKTRKFSESGLSLPRYEGADTGNNNADKDKGQQQTTSVSSVANRQTRARASVVANISEQQTTSQATTQNKIRRSPRVASTLDSDAQNKDQDSHEEESGDENEAETTTIEQKSRRGGRGRKKTASGDASKTSDTTEVKTPAKERLTIALPRDSSEKSSEHRKSLSPYDVFEFRDSDDETPSLPLHEAMHPGKKETETTTTTKTVSDEKKACTSIPPSLSSAGLLIPVVSEDLKGLTSSQTEAEKKEDKEYTTELSSHGKLSITIRLKDGQDAGVAEVVKTSKALIPPASTCNVVSDEASKSSSKGSVASSSSTSSLTSTAMTAAEQEEVKATRKSARLMSQNKNTVDEIIEDVIKGKEGRLRRLQRAARKSGENDTSNSQASSSIHPDSNDDELSEDTETRDRHSRSYRITRSSTRGSTGSEIEDASGLLDETSSHSNTCLPQRRHSHPTPGKEKISGQQHQQQEPDDGASTSSVVELPSHPPPVTATSSSFSLSSLESETPGLSHPPLLPSTSTQRNLVPETVSLSASSTPVISSALSSHSVIQEPVRTTVIPSVSERIHNSTTAQKLKTGKGFIHLDSSQDSSGSFSVISSSVAKIASLVQDQQQQQSSSLQSSPAARLDDQTGDNKHVLAAKDRVQPPPAHTKITIEAKQPAIQSGPHFPSVAEKTSPVIVQSRRTPDVMQTQPGSQHHVPPHFASIPGRPDLDPRVQVPLSKDYILQQQELLQRMHREQGRPTPPPSSPLGPASNLPPELQQHLRQLSQAGQMSGLPPHLALASHANMPYDAYAAQFMLQQQYAMHPDLARGHLPPRLPYGIPPPASSDAAKLMALEKEQADKNKAGRQKEQDRVEEDFKRSQEEQQRQQQLLMPSPGPSHLRGYPAPSGLIRPGIPPHLLSPHDRVTDSPAVIHGFHTKPGHDMMHSPASKGQQHPGQYIHPSIASPAPGFLDGRPLHQAAHSPGSHVFRPKDPSITQREEEARKNAQLQHQAFVQGRKDLSSPLSVNLSAPPGFHLPPHLQGHPEEGLLRRAVPEGPGMALVPQVHSVSQPHHPQTPHAAQTASGDSDILERYPIVWQGLLALKNDQAAVQFHFISGSSRLAQDSLPKTMAEGGTASLKISQRMRLEQSQLEGVARKMQTVDEHCILLALPCGRDHMEVLQQSNHLRNGFINYLQSKQAAGIVNSTSPGHQATAYVIHIFPSSDFSNGSMARIAPDLLHVISDIAHLTIIIATVA